MSTRFIRKRYRRVIPVKRARLRESHLMRGEPIRYRRHYPLYESASIIYNYNNLIECLNNWNAYSGDTVDNMKNVVSILETMASFEQSTSQEINEATRVICNNILPYIQEPNKYSKYFEKITEDKLQESKNKILDEIYIISECDRILENYKTINEEFNILKFFQNNLKVMSLSEALYKFCDKVEDFNIEYPVSFCVAMETALYALDHLVTDEVDKRAVSEGIIDYYLVNGGNEDLNAFAESLEECLQKDEFLPNEINDYMLYIQNVLNKDDILRESIDEYFENNIDMQCMGDYNNIIRNNAYEVVQEFKLFDKAKEIMTKFKALPNKTTASVKEAINALFVTSRLQDMKKNTLNALSIIFYFVLGGAVAVGIGAGVIGALLSFLIMVNIHHASNKEYLQDAIDGWTQHKSNVERRLKTADANERAKLTTYLDEVEKNLNILKNKYENMRDETSEEISRRASADAYANPSDDMINPIGENPLDNQPAPNKGVKEEYELLIELASLDYDSMVDNIKSRIASDLSDSSSREIKHKLLELLNFLLLMAMCGIVVTMHLGPFLNIIIIFTALTLIEVVSIADKEYQRNAISAWKEHKKSVEKKLQKAEGNDKTILTTYLKYIDKGLSMLENAKNKVVGR